MTDFQEAQNQVVVNAGEGPYGWAVANVFLEDGMPYALYQPNFKMPYMRQIFAWLGSLPRRGRMVGMKPTQMGFSTTMMIFTLWFMNKCKENALYMLRTDGELGQFVQERFDPIIANSPNIAAGFTATDNVHVKRGWDRTLYFRGAEQPKKLKEMPVGLLIRDEKDVMVDLGAEMALGRLAASKYQWVADIGNPSYPEIGIDADYLGGTQHQWWVLCAYCNEWFIPDWPQCIVRSSPDRVVCSTCGKPHDFTLVGEWRPKVEKAPYISWTIPQVCSPRVLPIDLLNDWDQAEGNPTKERTFYNNRLGKPYASAGAKLDMAIIHRLTCSGSAMVAGSVAHTVMGIDVGGSEGDCLHVTVRALDGEILWAGVKNWEEADDALDSYNVLSCGIDAMPETYMAKLLAQKNPDRGIKLIRYHSSPVTVGGTVKEKDGVEFVSVARTATLDQTFSLIHKPEDGLVVPTGLPVDYWDQFTCMVRKIVDTGKHKYATYDEGSAPDHYAHSLNYSEVVRDKSGSFEERFQIW